MQGNSTFFSQTARNADGVDHLYAYQGTGTPFLTGPLERRVLQPRRTTSSPGRTWLGGGDRDYQDFVAVVQDVSPVPLPPAVLLLISGLVGLAGVSRRTA